MAATGEAAVVAVTVNPAGARTTASRWLIHTAWRSGRPCSSTPGATAVISALPNSAVPVRATSPPSIWASSWWP